MKMLRWISSRRSLIQRALYMQIPLPYVYRALIYSRVTTWTHTIPSCAGLDGRPLAAQRTSRPLKRWSQQGAWLQLGRSAALSLFSTLWNVRYAAPDVPTTHSKAAPRFCFHGFMKVGDESCRARLLCESLAGSVRPGK